MTTYRNIFERTILTSELAEIHLSKDEPLGETVKRHQKPGTEIKKIRRFMTRVLDVETEQWSRATINQLRNKSAERSTKYPKTRAFGYELHNYERFLSRHIGTEAYIGTPKSDVFIRLYVIDEERVIADARDADKLELFLTDWI